MHDKDWIYCIAVILVGVLTGLEMFSGFLEIWLDFFGPRVWRARLAAAGMGLTATVPRLASLTMVMNFGVGFG